ncbi:RNA polymerase sigma factor [Mycobacterium sp. IDR2000157661]|uniref:RNA polymerase sigma factor n=1 Tax=Mycobacterium sp. IDR2000157661 TaxID=2867005 RepID=UPI001EE9B025|nr:sigma-70 family RNA polymerase sigma factor [Mycobacterium sp. IDR2000157661]ULE31993.1 sigma-70 family RNA polymerase sigma factor [Mycobacterium sp. IDR2000157661]
MTAAVPKWNIVGHRSTDADLVRAAVAGDRQAFAVMYDRYANRLHDFCAGMLADRDAAADCVQDAFCTAATCLGDLREPDRLRAWLYGIARHQALRRIRDRRREQLSDELPDIASGDAGPDTMAGRTELANLISEAAGGLSDRDRAVLELAYRHGLDGTELADALGVTQTNANTMVYRLRETIEKCLGALLVARRTQSAPEPCPELAAILKGWDGQFTMLMRKRIARHLEGCPSCDSERRRMVNPVALLGAAPIFIPAPAWLRDRTLREVQLTCAGTGMMNAVAPTQPVRPQIHWRRDDAPVGPPVADGHQATTDADEKRARKRFVLLIGLFAGVPLAVLALTISWTYLPTVAVDPSSGTQPVAPQSVPAPVGPPPAVAPPGMAPPDAPASRAPAPARSPAIAPPPSAAQRVPSAGTPPQPIPAQQPNAIAPQPATAAPGPPLPNIVIPQLPLSPQAPLPAPAPLPGQYRLPPPAVPDDSSAPAPQLTAAPRAPAPSAPPPQPGLGDSGLIPTETVAPNPDPALIPPPR